MTGYRGAPSMLRYDYAALIEFATALGHRAGLPSEKAKVQAEVLVEADLMGHTTHGLNLLPGFLKDTESGAVNAAGELNILSDGGSAIVWDGNGLPGTWLVSEAIAEGRRRIQASPVITFVIKRSGHIAALSAYLRQATDAGLIIYLVTTNPMMRTVVPAGGIEPLLAPNPLAFGYPTDGDPVLIDISTSAVANGWVRRWANEKKRLPEKWLQDSEGNLTDDPSALFGPPPGALLPLGGVELGHKGFALGLIVEALTSGLSGVGHTAKPAAAGNLVFLQLIHPAAFCGLSEFKRDASVLADACRASRPRAGSPPVRMPGDGALARRRAQLDSGVELYPSIMTDLQKWAAKYSIKSPAPTAVT
jgi:LDH2 family malate/lactate/ureidoglycolate dehydrogenase